jgi:hypothetical protein
MSAPTWDEIIDRTDDDLRAERFLGDHGFRSKVEEWGEARYRAELHRGGRSFSFNLPADNGRPPGAHTMLVTVLLRAAMDSKFARRARAFLTEDELKGLEKVL